MSFTKEQKKEAYKKLSPEVQSFITDNETTELIGNYLKNSGLIGEQSDSADTEILNSMFGLQTLQEAISNIAKLSGKNINELSKLKSDLENNIFSKIPSIKNVNIDWEGKVEEISKKYNLNDGQNGTLNSICKEILLNMNKKGELLSNLDQKIGISKLLSEQIIDDLNKRVFDYASKTTEPKPINKSGIPTPPSIQQVVKPVIPQIQTQNNNKIPEIKPNNLPTIQLNKTMKKNNIAINNNSPKIEVPKFTPTGTINYKPTGLNGGSNEIKKDPVIEVDSRIQYKPVSNPISSGSPTEPVQRPKEVPRFNAVIDEVLPETPSSPSGIVDSKLSTVTAGIKEPEQGEVKKENPIVKQYTVDPYREPLA